MKKNHYMLLAALLAGVVLAPQIRKLPLLNKLPTL